MSQLHDITQLIGAVAALVAALTQLIATIRRSP